MNVKTTTSKGVGIVIIVGLVSLILGPALVPATATAGDVLLVSVAMTASPGTICIGQSTRLTWSSTDATSIIIDQGIGSVTPYGARDISPTQTTTYTITGTNSTGGYATASLTVLVSGLCPTPTPTWTPTPTPTWTPTPTPLPSYLTCAPSVQSVQSGQRVYFSATYPYYAGDLRWTAVGGSPSNGTGSSFNTRFYTSSINETRLVSVTDGYRTATCVVYVFGATPTPTVSSDPTFTLDHTVRNLTSGSGDSSSVTARNGDRLRFTTRIKMGNEYGQDVHIRDWLPQYASYVYGSTTVDGVYYQDGIATGNSNDSLALGTLAPNRTYVVRFEATVWNAPTITLKNSVNVQMRYAPVQNRTSTVKFVASSNPTPTPTWTPTPTGNGLALTVAGRNITGGQTGEYATVHARAGNTIEFVLRVRSLSGSNLHNVYLTDSLPAGMMYIANTTVLNGYIVSDGITGSGLNIGTLAAGQEAVIRFSALVDASAVPTWGQATATNGAQARADGVSPVSASMKVTFGKYLATTASSVATGPADSLLLALAAAALVTGIYARYTRTGSFNRRMAATEIGRMSGSTTNFLR